MVIHVYMIHYHQIQRCSIHLDTGILQIIFTAAKQYSRSLAKVNQMSPIRNSEVIVICVRWELSFSQAFSFRKNKSQTNLQLCIIADPMDQATSNCPDWGQAGCLIRLLSVAGFKFLRKPGHLGLVCTQVSRQQGVRRQPRCILESSLGSPDLATAGSTVV